LLFLFKPEGIHDFIFSVLPWLSFLYPILRSFFGNKVNWQDININGIIFKNRLGVAAGLDKDGTAIRFFEALGFSHVEVGTVTPVPQTGNPKPRLFRLQKDSALINRMGFNNKGADALRKRIITARRKIKKDFVIGVNIGKNKDTPIEKAADDYKICMEKLYDVADYFTVNVSSPNTEGLRSLQSEKYLDNLLRDISEYNIRLAVKYELKPRSIFLKIAPDLTPDEVEKIFIKSIHYEITGIVATNTTITRNNLISDVNETGGLSGKPLKALSDDVLKQLSDMNTHSPFGKLAIIGVGGVFSNSDYKDKLLLGADLVQVYTGFIYGGFAFPGRVLG